MPRRGMTEEVAGRTGTTERFEADEPARRKKTKTSGARGGKRKASAARKRKGARKGARKAARKSTARKGARKSSARSRKAAKPSKARTARKGGSRRTVTARAATPSLGAMGGAASMPLLEPDYMPSGGMEPGLGVPEETGGDDEI